MKHFKVYALVVFIITLNSCEPEELDHGPSIKSLELIKSATGDQDKDDETRLEDEVKKKDIDINESVPSNEAESDTGDQDKDDETRGGD